MGFQQKKGAESQEHPIATFERPLVASAHCVTQREKYSDVGILINYKEDDFSQCFGQYKKAFRALTNADILQPFMSDKDFRSSKDEECQCYWLFFTFSI